MLRRRCGMVGKRLSGRGLAAEGRVLRAVLYVYHSRLLRHRPYLALQQVRSGPGRSAGSRQRVTGPRGAPGASSCAQRFGAGAFLSSVRLRTVELSGSAGSVQPVPFELSSHGGPRLGLLYSHQDLK